MFRNHFIIAWRSLMRNKTNSLINIGGLAIGIACVVFIVLYVQDERSYDRGFAHADRIYQVNLNGNFGGQQFNAANTPPPIAIDLHHEFPEVETYTRVYRLGNEVIRNPAPELADRAFTEKHLWAVDSNFLQVFSYRLLEGNAASCLTGYHSLVLTETMARKYFGSSPAIGRQLLLDEYSSPFVVTGILKDLPTNASLQFDILMPIKDCPPVQRFSWSWVWSQLNAYVVLNEKTAGDAAAIKRLETKFPALVRRDAAKAFERIGQPFDEFIKKGGKWDFYLQPLTAIHLHSAGIGTQVENLGDIKYVYIFSVIAVFIVLLACINFMNLSTAQAVKRAKEVGIRKVLGSLRGSLIRQFLTEAWLCTALAAVLGLLLVVLFMHPFNALSGKSLQFTDLLRPGCWTLVVLLLGVTGLLAGSYPAFYLTSFQPVEVFKGGKLFTPKGGSRLIRNGLVVFQFTVSIALIICTIIVYRQLQFVQTQDLGFKKENVLILPNIEKLGDLDGKVETMRQQMGNIPGVRSASLTSGMPANDNSLFTDFYVPLTNGVKEPLSRDVTLTSYVVDEQFVPSLHLQLVAGRNFSKAFSDSASVIVNESTVRHIGWKDPIGKRLRYPGNDDRVFTVIGVVRDFNFISLRNTVDPFALFHTSSRTFHANTGFVAVNMDAAHTREVLGQAERIWKAFAPGIPFDYSFLDKDYEALYRSEQRMGGVFTSFTVLSLLVACLGLFGLAVYTAERRVKEIGIRKILGASVQSVVGLLSREFIKLVAISAVIAFPLAWWAMHTWLQDFAYRVTISPWVFVVAAVTALGIALATVSSQAIRAATRNPATSLRSE